MGRICKQINLHLLYNNFSEQKKLIELWWWYSSFLYSFVTSTPGINCFYLLLITTRVKISKILLLMIICGMTWRNKIFIRLNCPGRKGIARACEMQCVCLSFARRHLGNFNNIHIIITVNISVWGSLHTCMYLGV